VGRAWGARGADRGALRVLLVAAVLATAVGPASGASARAPAQVVAQPVISTDFPDPAIVWDPDSGRWFAFATNVWAGRWSNVPVRSSPDLVDWSTEHGDALPQLPSWARSGPATTWAPGVVRVGGRWVLYLTARHRSSDRQCVGVAVAARPEGPYEPVGTRPLVCQTSLGGSIDPSPYVDPTTGHLWLHWKSDENTSGGGGASRIFAQRLGDGGRSLVGPRVPMLGATHPIEDFLVENPSMIHARGHHWLLYSAGQWDSVGYLTHVARCVGPAGPCTKVTSPHEPVLSMRNGVAGPGGAHAFYDGAGRPFLAFHAWYPRVGYDDGGQRVTHITRLSFDGPRGTPRIRPDLSPTGSPGQRITDGSRPPAPPSTSFPDVPRSSYFARPVAWAVDLGITNGDGSTGLFVPHRSASRAEVATLLFRAAGSPARGGPRSSDVPPGSYFDAPTRWMRGLGITTGVGGTSAFEPHRAVTRAEAVAFLWRLAGSPDPQVGLRFRDVVPGSFYDPATRWADRHGITTGVGGTDRFEPDRPVTRAEMVTFLWRYAFALGARGERAVPVIG
jgi:hypothetical protein